MKIRCHPIWILYGAIALLVLVGLVQIFAVGLGNDEICLLLYAQHFLQDGQLYSRWVEMNPPMVFFFYSIPAALISYAEIPPELALHGMTGLYMVVSLLLIWHETSRSDYSAYQRSVILCAALFVLCLLPSIGFAFTDREHWLFIFILPWVITILHGRSPTIWTSIWAAIGICIKPYNVIIFVALALFAGPANMSLKQRIWNISNRVIILIGLIYLSIVGLFFIDYIKLIPTLLTAYTYIQHPLDDKLETFYQPAFCFFVLLLCSNIAYKKRWMAFFVACLCVYFLNGGWYYTRYLLYAPLGLMAVHWLGWAIVSISDKYPRWIYRSCLVIPCIAIGWMGYHSFQNLHKDITYTQRIGYAKDYHYRAERTRQEMRDQVNTKDVIMLSTTLWASSVVGLQGDYRHVLGYNYLWTLPWLVTYPDHELAGPMRQRLFDDVEDSLTHYPNASLIVDVSPNHRRIKQRSFNILTYFKQSHGIAAQLHDYQMVEQIRHCHKRKRKRCAFDIWQRK